MAAQYTYGSSADPVAQAAQFLHRLLTKTPFLEGNRRTAFIAMLTLLNANGYAVRGRMRKRRKPLPLLPRAAWRQCRPSETWPYPPMPTCRWASPCAN